MAHENTIFRFAASVSMDEVRTTLQLARLAAASLHGEERVRLHADTHIDAAKRICEIDTSREAGQTLALIFGGYVRREFGEDAVFVQRIASLKQSAAKEILT